MMAGYLTDDEVVALVACSYGACTAERNAPCMTWSAGQPTPRNDPHESRRVAAQAKALDVARRHAFELENVVRDLIGWNPCPFPPEVVANAQKLLGAMTW